MNTHRLTLVRLVVIAIACAVVGIASVATGTALATVLPDGRVYEAVSPIVPGIETNVDVPEPGSEDLSTNFEHGVTASMPFEVSSDGNRVVYAGDPASVGGDGHYGAGGGNEFLATRAPDGGWTADDLQLEGRQIQYQAFSSDLSVGVSGSKPLIESANQSFLLYAHPTSAGVVGEYWPFITDFSSAVARQNNAKLGSYGNGGLFNSGANAGTPESATFSHLLFEANNALTPNAIEAGPEYNNLYDNVDMAELHLVNVLPKRASEPSASFGSARAPQTQGPDPPDLSNVISNDGSRIFWSSLELVREEESGNVLYGRPKSLYVRLNDTQSQSPLGPKDECMVPADACTVQVDASVGGGGFFWTASADGSKVFFTKGDPTGELYEYDLDNGETTDLTPGVQVAGVAGASEDGEYIYYADTSNES